MAALDLLIFDCLLLYDFNEEIDPTREQFSYDGIDGALSFAVFAVDFDVAVRDILLALLARESPILWG